MWRYVELPNVLSFQAIRSHQGLDWLEPTTTTTITTTTALHVCLEKSNLQVLVSHQIRRRLRLWEQLTQSLDLSKIVSAATAATVRSPTRATDLQ